MMYPNQQVPNYYQNPYNFGNQITGSQLIRVNGIDSAKAYQTQPNSTVALFDANDDIMYIKSTDASNFPTIRRFRFIEEPETQVVSEKYVTMSEFQKFKEEILNAKQSVQSTQSNEQYSANKKHDEYGKNK